MKSYLIKCGLLIVFIASGSIQTSFGQNVSGDTLKSMMVKDWERAKTYTDAYLNVMPGNKYSFTPNDSIRTFAQQMLHLAQANMFFIMTATDEKPTFGGRDLEKTSSAQSADSVRYYVDKSYDFAIQAIKNLSPGKFMEIKTINMGQAMNATRLSWLNKAFEHQTHHRGQTTIYLRTAGMHPPQEMLF